MPGPHTNHRETHISLLQSIFVFVLSIYRISCVQIFNFIAEHLFYMYVSNLIIIAYCAEHWRRSNRPSNNKHQQQTDDCALYAYIVFQTDRCTVTHFAHICVLLPDREPQKCFGLYTFRKCNCLWCCWVWHKCMVCRMRTRKMCRVCRERLQLKASVVCCCCWLLACRPLCAHTIVREED